jgi:bis(5'-adenosyl)-triphosphatase
MCPFCSKTEKDFYLETQDMAAIYNVSPIVPGHSLVIPKRHVESIFELTERELVSLMTLGRAVAALLTEMFNTDAFNMAIQEKEASGQSVPHLHMHVVPRTMGDLPRPGDWYQALERTRYSDIDTFERFQLTEKQLAEVTARLKAWTKSKSEEK